ncbi:MAG: gluconolactonase [Phenylobacterium sp.]|jgi:gluconolactonase
MRQFIIKAGVIGVILAALPLSMGLSAANYQASDWVSDGTFTTGIEGPATDLDGTLYAVNFGKEGTIGRVVGQNKVELLTQLPGKSTGNGIRFDHHNNMYIADYVGHNILQIKSGEQKVRVYAHSSAMTQPNDIAITDSGILFASDPKWQDGTGQLWKISTDQKVTLLEKGMGTTNGVAVSPDNNKLYVNESVQRNVWVYDIDKNGDISNKQLFIAFKDHGMDGMRTDQQGNLYIARYGAGVVAIVSPQGKLIREVKLKGQHPTNVAFGGQDNKTVFVTLQKRGAIEYFTSEFAGSNYRKH